MSYNEDFWDEEESVTCPFGICDGSGEMIEMEPVYAGEPHVAPIGIKKCLCKEHEPEYDNQD